MTKITLALATTAALLIAPIAAFATPVALGGTSTRGAHMMSHKSHMSSMMMKKRMMMKKKKMMMMKHHM